MLSELTESIVNEMDKLRVEAQQRESEADKLVKDTIAALKMWDEKTVELVSQLQQARDEHVSKQNCVTLCSIKRILSSVFTSKCYVMQPMR